MQDDLMVKSNEFISTCRKWEALKESETGHSYRASEHRPAPAISGAASAASRQICRDLARTEQDISELLAEAQRRIDQGMGIRVDDGHSAASEV